MEETLKYVKTREVKSPCRAHGTDAGIDFFVPTSLTQDDMAQKYEVVNSYPTVEVGEDGFIKKWILLPGESILIPSGIKVKVPDGYMLQFHNKSGVASKRHLLVGANTVDIGYEGECHINLHNVGDEEQAINAGDKIVQGIIIPVNFAMPEEVDNESILFKDSTSERKENGFGSTGNS